MDGKLEKHAVDKIFVIVDIREIEVIGVWIASYN